MLFATEAKLRDLENDKKKHLVEKKEQEQKFRELVEKTNGRVSSFENYSQNLLEENKRLKEKLLVAEEKLRVSEAEKGK